MNTLYTSQPMLHSVLMPEHSAQTINYLKATEIEVGLLINFGRPKIEYKRLHK